MPTATEECVISQTGVQNRAVVFQLIVQTKGAGQTGTQTANITQGPGATGGTSLNDSSVGQAVKQRIGGTAADDDDNNDDHGDRRLAAVDPTQVQDAYQSAVVTQTATGSGRNASRILQSQRQREIGGNPQSQNTNPNPSDCAPAHGVNNPNACANVSQSNVDGNNSNVLVQLSNSLARTGVAGAIQVQGNVNGGQDGRVHQDTSAAGKSTNQAYQSKTWTLTTPSGSQTQHDPSSCCGFASQDGGTGNSETINQTANLTATGDSNPSQTINLTGESTQPTDTVGNCTITQFANVNGVSTPNSDSESPCPFLLLETSCINGDGHFCTASPPDTTPPDSPVSKLTKCVRRTDIAQDCTSASSGSFGSPFEYQIDYSNVGTGTGHNVTVTDVVPADWTIVSCSEPDKTGASCSFDNDTHTVTFIVGDVLPDNSWSMSFNATSSCTGFSNVATGKADEEPAPASSNPAVVTLVC
ncbi:MAG: hypothetical protein WAQ33_12375 [Gaiellaceae bacterium]